MKTRTVALLLALAGCSTRAPLSTDLRLEEAAVYDSAASAKVSTRFVTIRDSVRNRQLAMKIYSPEEGTGPFPIVLFSHGLGSSRSGYGFLGRHWASKGYISIHPQHAGSDSELVRTKGYFAAYRSGYAPPIWADRSLDMKLVLDELERAKEDASSPLSEIASRADLRRIAVAGHSYGAHTALTIAGMRVNFPEQAERSFMDQRVSAAIVLSAPPMEASPNPASFRDIGIPVLHMTGTRDTSRIFQTTLRHRRRPFDSISGPPQYFISLNEGQHRTFADMETVKAALAGGRLDAPVEVPRSTAGSPHPQHVDIILNATSAFLDAHLCGSTCAKRPVAVEWLNGGGLLRYMGNVATYELKNGAGGESPAKR